MKVSIITVVLNAEDTIRDTINSILEQTYDNIEYIIVDGLSNDATIEIIQGYGNKISKFVSEADNGLYDAMNKGVSMATGDIIGILNSDDFYLNNNVIDQVVKVFKDKHVDSVFANLVYISPNDTSRVVRYFDSGQFKPSLFAYGLMPAHPTFFVKKNIYDKYGSFHIDLKNAADFELMARFIHTYKISYFYMERTIVKMRMGGASTSITSIGINNVEILKACKLNGIKTNFFKISFRYVYKIMGVFKRMALRNEQMGSRS
jgi:glycosyltransferase involved in cell wall biosynthesis